MTPTKTSNGKTVHVDLAAMQAMILALQAENEKLKAKTNRPLTMKVSEKGAMSLYGMGQVPCYAVSSTMAQGLRHG